MVISACQAIKSSCKTKQTVSKNACLNAIGVVLLIAQGCQTIVQATLG